jgi:hypothetical protein
MSQRMHISRFYLGGKAGLACSAGFGIISITRNEPNPEVCKVSATETGHIFGDIFGGDSQLFLPESFHRNIFGGYRCMSVLLSCQSQPQTGIQSHIQSKWTTFNVEERYQKRFRTASKTYPVNILNIEAHSTSSKHYLQKLQSHKGMTTNISGAL